MSPIQNLEQHARQLVEPDISIQARLTMAMEVRDSLEIAHTEEYLNFLKCYFRAFSVILLQITKPQCVDNTEQKLRNVVLEILNRLHPSEVLRPCVQDLLKVTLQVLTTDNEENGLICIHIIFDLLRNFRPTLENEVQPFLDFLGKIYQNFSLTVSHVLESGAIAPPPLDASDLNSPGSSGLAAFSSGNGVSSQLNPSTRSFKIVTESLLVVMFLFQLYNRLVQTNIPFLLPLMVSAISAPGPNKVPPHLKTHFTEFQGAQVKTVSFLTHLLKSFADYIRPHEESICKSIVNLLVTCSDSVSIRKELLEALKHVLGTDFKRGLFSLIDTLLKERVLVGSGRACFETLRPLAYSLLAEIIHHVRGDLSLSQMSRMIYLLSSNMHDASLSLSIHTTCARLMLNLVEPIFEKGVDQSSMDESWVLLGRILDAFVGKFSTFKRTIPQLLEEGDNGKDRASLKSKVELPMQELEAQDKLLDILINLNPESDISKNQILSSVPIPSLNNTYELVLQVEKQKQLWANNAATGDPMAFMAGSQSTGSNGTSATNPGGGNRSRKDRKKAANDKKLCSYCNMKGHLAHTCFKLIGYPNWYKGKKGKRGEKLVVGAVTDDTLIHGGEGSSSGSLDPEFLSATMEMSNRPGTPSATRNDQQRDRLSELPLGIIHEILGRVPTRDAITMCVLSSEWRYTWTTLPFLVFKSQQGDEPSEIFDMRSKNFITNVLLHHQGPIHSFKVSYPRNHGIGSVENWLLRLASKDLKNLFLLISSDGSLESSLYECLKLTQLNVQNFRLSPPPVRFKGFLFLTMVSLAGAEICTSGFESLVSHCPVLGFLSLLFCRMDQVRISSPSLKHLHITGCHSKLILHAPKLVRIHVHLEAWPGLQDIQSKGCNYTDFLGNCPNLIHLIGTGLFTVNLSIGLSKGHHTLVFHHLKVIELRGVIVSDISDIAVVARLLKDAPNLEKIVLGTYHGQTDGTPAASFRDHFRFPSIFTLEKLKEIKLVCVCDCPSGVQLAKFLLQTSPALETMEIEVASSHVDKVSNELLSSGAAASYVKTTFVVY